MKPSEEGLKISNSLCDECKEKLNSLLAANDVKGVNTNSLKGKLKLVKLTRKIMNNVCWDCQQKILSGARGGS